MFGKKQKPMPVSTPLQESAKEPVPENDAGMFQKFSPFSANKNATYESEDIHMMGSDLTASVSKNTTFTGNIVSNDNIEIFGDVEGSVTGTALVKIHGKVSGDITCGVLVAGNASITGNISCEKSAVFGDNTTVVGNIMATVVSVSGQVNGNIDASESVSVSSKGSVYGDIHTPEMEVSKGAIVFGSVVMEQPVKVEEEPVPQQEVSETSVVREEPQAVLEAEVDSDDDTFSPWKMERRREEKPSPLALES